MNILQINGTFGGSSTGSIVKQISDECIKRGWGSEVAYLYSYSFLNDCGKRGYRVCGWISHRAHNLFTRMTGKEGFGSPLATFKLIRYIKKIKPDVVHLHNLHESFIHIGILFHTLKKLDIPVVITLHDCWFFTGKCRSLDNGFCFKWKTCCKNCPEKHSYPPSWFFDQSTRNFRKKEKLLTSLGSRLTIVGVSDWVSEICKQSFLKNQKIVTIKNGVDTSIFYPKDSSELRNKYHTNGRKIILGMARKWNLNANKSEVDAIIQFAQQNKALIILIGPTAIKNNVTINVPFIENPTELAAFYSLADVFVNLSIADTMSLVTMESLACGTPTIVHNCMALPYTLGKNHGYVIEPGDVAALITSLKECINDKINSSDCVKYAQENNVDKMTKKYIDLYDSLQAKR